MGSHLSASQWALLEAHLHQRCRKLQEQLAAHLHGQSPVEHAREVLLQDGDDAPQRLPERDIAAALTDYERIALLQARAALDRMERGSYGSCRDCGADIPFGRLEAEPDAERCIACESRREKKG
jgi:DnaK suppressor protein